MSRRKATKKTDVDITNHKLVPYHEIISEEEKEKLFEKYDIKPEHLPKILDDDPVATAIGAKPGQIIKIERESQTANKAVVYRLVVKSSK